MKIVKSLKYSGLLIKGVTQTIENKIKGQRSGFRGMLQEMEEKDKEPLEQDRIFNAT